MGHPWISQRIGCLTRRMGVGQKISCGYALALGIAIFGTSAGFAIGDRFYEKARDRMLQANDEGQVVSALQGVMLEAQSHQQELVLLLEDRQEFQDTAVHMMSHVDRAKVKFSDLKSFAESTSSVTLNQLVKHHDGTLEAYFQHLEKLIKQLEPFTGNPDKIPQAQQLLLKSIDSLASYQFRALAHELTQIAATVHDRQMEADDAQIKAGILQKLIVAVSILMSVAIASMLALYTSRAIADPIKAVTNVAQQVTADANFNLQAPVSTEDEIGILATSLNQLIQQVKHLLDEQKAASERQLVQNEKLASLGQMLAGIAHEINNPLNCIYGNITYTNQYLTDLLKLLQTWDEEVPQTPSAVLEKSEEIEFEFLKEDLPKLLESMKVSAERAKAIVYSLKDFSRLDEAKPHAVDLHSCIDSTLLILNNRLKNDITVVRNYGDVPAIEGFTGLLYQVFMNLLSNAIDAVQEKPVKQITITTERKDDDSVVVRIADNGSGMSSETKDKIFEAFFTTKPRGVGTGIGLAITHQIVREKHGGTITCESDFGQGTEFTIALPIKLSSQGETAGTRLIHAAL